MLVKVINLMKWDDIYSTLPIVIFTFFGAINSYLSLNSFHLSYWCLGLCYRARNEAVHNRLGKTESENKLVVS